MSGLIIEPGVYDLSDEDYQRDICETPSLRSSTAWKLVSKGSTPRHAWHSCSRLNPAYKQPEKKHFTLGKAVHKLVLGKGAALRVIEEEDYKTKAARAMRDLAVAAGEIPILSHEFEQVTAMAYAAKVQMQELVDAGTIQAFPFHGVQTERTIVWYEGDTICRAMLDGLPDDLECISEFKTDGESADPQTWQWKARRYGYFFRLAMYRRGLEKLKLAFSPAFHFYVQETVEPYLLSHIRVDDELIAQEDEKVKAAIKIWQRCMSTGHWPGYNIEGYDVGLTEKEKFGDNLQNTNNPASPYYHLASEDVA